MKHLTEDNENLERYVLKRLSAEERAGAEVHLAECLQCREAVERERTLAEGVRSFAREQLKKRLKENVRQDIRVPWPHILSAAAMVLIVVGLGYYNDWWTPAAPPVSEDVTRFEAEQPEEAPGEAGEIRLEDSPLRADEPATEGAPARETPEQRRRSEERYSRERQDFRIQDQPAAEDPAAAMGMAAASSIDEDRPLWIQGSVVEKPKEMADAVADKRAFARSAEKVEAREMEAPSSQAQLISVSQQPLSKVPPHQSAQPGKPGILASVQMINNVLELTVFSDTLELTGKEIHVEQVTEDSLIITLNGTQVAYKIPGGWGGGKNVLKLQE